MAPLAYLDIRISLGLQGARVPQAMHPVKLVIAHSKFGKTE
jgi:hypothetical protein